MEAFTSSWLSTYYLKNIITINGVKNCPITIGDINITEKIFGKDIAYLKDK